MPLSQLDLPLSQGDLITYKTALENLQGNILKSHGRDAAMHVFLTFRAGAQADARALLARLAAHVTSAAEQRAQTLRNPHGHELFMTLYLTAQGYQYLGYTDRKTFSPEFWNGMRTAQLGDPEPKDWEPQFQNQIHAMVLFAHETVAETERQRAQLAKKARAFADIASELGTASKVSGSVVEHFGYVDGISQPLFFESDLKGVPVANWNPGAGPNLVLTRDPYGASEDDCGTYFVFRKLEQNVQGFRGRVQHLANELHLSGRDAARAGAMVVGRFPNGSPAVTLPPQNPPGKAPANDFNYVQSDPNGNQCPFSAHIRKTNPRGQTAHGLNEERTHRIARRGITYGEFTPLDAPLESVPKTGVGLLFQCCQADLANQFEFLMTKWVGNNDFLRNGTGKDPVIGQSNNGAFPHLQFPNGNGTTPFSFHGFVTMKGGEYFFAPSLTFLRKLE